VNWISPPGKIRVVAIATTVVVPTRKATRIHDPMEGGTPVSDYFFAPEEYLTERLLLRPYQPGDGAELSAAVLESYEHLKPWMPWATESQSEEESEQLVRTFRAGFLLAQNFVFAIRTTDDRRLLGGAGFHLREGPLSSGNAEIGMWIRSSEANKGIGSEALRALIEWGFTEWPWNRLSWRCDLENKVSIQLAQKAGMQREGILRQHMRNPAGEVRNTACHAILKEEWTSRAD